MATKVSRKRIKRASLEALVAKIRGLPAQTEECSVQTALEYISGALAEKIAGGYTPKELLAKLDLDSAGLRPTTFLQHARAVKKDLKTEPAATGAGSRGSSNGSSNGNGQPAIPPPVTSRVEAPKPEVKSPTAATTASDKSQAGGIVKVQPIDTIEGVPKTVSSITNNLRRREY